MRSILLCTLFIAAGVAMLRAQDSASVPAADGFQCPVGVDGTAEGYYIARSFRSNGHLGDDWNGIRGGDTDYGDPVYTIGHGVVVFAKNYHVGWGNVVIIRHAYHEGFALRYVDSLYGHLADFTVREGQIVRRGQKIGRIGSNNGMYDAHLHFEIRKNINIGMYRSSFPRDGTNYYVPNQFIAAHLTCSGGNKTVSVPINTFPATAPPSYAAAKVYTPVYSPGTAPASHRAPAGAGSLPARGLRTTEPPPAPKVVTASPPTPRPAAPPTPVVETPTTASTTKKGALPPVASKGSPIASSDKKDSPDKKDSSEKEEPKKESPPPPSSKTSKTASTKTSKESPPKAPKESESKEPEKKESTTASSKKTEKGATPPTSAKNTATASTKTGTTKTAATAAKPAPTPSKSSTVASKKPSSTTAKEPAAAKPPAPEPAPEKAAKAEPKPSILEPTPLPPTISEGSPIRRSAPGFRVDRFQDLRGLGY